jgi:ABC-type branched-subunit amino acid transport system substrate-binding protein
MVERRGTRWLPVVVSALVLTGCGTTVPLRTSAGTTRDGLGGPEAAVPSVADGATVPVASASAPAVSPTDAQPLAAGPTATGPQAPARSAGLPGPRRSLPPIQIGSYYLQGGSAAVAAIGFAGIVIPDNKPLTDAMVTYLNAHGGLGGRKIQLVWFQYSSTGDPHAQDAAACADFTQDHHVYLVLGGISSGAGDLEPCLNRHGVPLIGANAGGDARYFAQNHRYVYEPGQASFTRGLATLVSTLSAQGWFSGNHPIGVVQYEGTTYDHAVDDGLVAPLARLGLKLTDRVSFSGVDNNSIASGAANAVVKFHGEGIDRVIFMAPGGAAATYFMNAASSQQWHPQYGVWSADSPYILGITASSDQLANARGIGYQPGLDVSGSQDPTATTPAGKKCLAFWDSVGQTDHSALNSPLQRATCDVVDTLLLAVAANADATTSTAALEQGYDAVGDRYQPAGTFVIRFRPGSHDAAAGYRELTYDVSCKCFGYTGPTRPLP